MSEEEVLTAQEAANFLKISTKLLYKLINAGELSARKVGNGFRLKKSVLLAYMNDEVDILTPGVLEDGLKDLGYEMPNEAAEAIRNFAYTVSEGKAKKRTLVETYGATMEQIYNNDEGETNV